MKSLFTITVLLISFVCFGQSYLRANEQVILSFQTNTHKQVYLIKDKSNRYISYRFGTKDKIELEYPAPKRTVGVISLILFTSGVAANRTRE